MKPLRIGVLALQGAFAEHVKSLRKCGAEAIEVRKVAHLQGLHGLIIPGGESTVMSKIMLEEGLMQPVQELGRSGLPIFGTCAGLIMLAKHIVEHENQASLGLLDVSVRRNAFGRQVESFCTNLPCLRPQVQEHSETDHAALGQSQVELPAVFIRAPLVEAVGDGVEVLASIDGKAVAVQQKNVLACSFHPELTEDTTWHQWLLEKAHNYAQTQLI